jgi:hypothetical protein
MLHSFQILSSTELKRPRIVLPASYFYCFTACWPQSALRARRFQKIDHQAWLMAVTDYFSVENSSDMGPARVASSFRIFFIPWVVCSCHSFRTLTAVIPLLNRNCLRLQNSVFALLIILATFYYVHGSQFLQGGASARCVNLIISGEFDLLMPPEHLLPT